MYYVKAAKIALTSSCTLNRNILVWTPVSILVARDKYFVIPIDFHCRILNFKEDLFIETIFLHYNVGTFCRKRYNFVECI